MKDASQVGLAPPPTTPAAQGANPEAVLPPHFDYFQGIIPEEPVICGLRMKPLSIGKYRMLARFKCAYVSEIETAAQAGDLLIGVIICSKTCEDFKGFVTSKDFQKEIRKWGSRFGFYPPRCFSWPVIGRRLEKIFGKIIAEADARYVMGEAALFAKYITGGAPDMSKQFMDEPSEGEFSGSHWSQNIEAVLREYQGWTREEVDEEPLSKAIFDFYKHMESRGHGRFLSPEEVADNSRELTPEEIEQAKKDMAALNEYLQKQREAANG